MKNKILIFTIGLLAGLTFGVLFSVAIKELLVQFKELHLSLNKINMKQSELSQRLDSIKGKLVPDAKKVAGTNSQSGTKTSAQGQQKNTAQHDSSKYAAREQTGVSSNTAAKTDSDVVVMTNQLVSVLSVHLTNKDTSAASKAVQATDSAIATMSDIGDSKGPLQYRIEFWKSPLNYKGYKMSAGKIVLYGINPEIPVNLTLDDGTYYLQVSHGVYRVYFTDDYRPFEKITDKAVFKKLGI